MEIQTILVYLIFAVCLLSALKWCYKRITRKRSDGCGCGCPGCTSARKGEDEENSCGCCSGDRNNRTCC